MKTPNAQLEEIAEPKTPIMPITIRIPLHRVRWMKSKWNVKQSAITTGGVHGSLQPKQKYIITLQ